MVKTNESHLPTELPKAVLLRLDPKLAGLYSQLPAGLASRISALMRAALPQGIHPNRVFRFAFLYATAEELTQRDADAKAVSKDHERRSKLELAGYIHGLRTGYRDDMEARKRYRRGRQARQQIKNSLEAVVTRWRVFEQIVRQHRSELPKHIQPRFSIAELREVGKLLHKMGIAATLDEEDLSIEKASERERSEIAQAYILWRWKMAPYRGKWNDMHRLAFAWHMSPAGSVKGFRTVVDRICKGAVSPRPLEKPWESILSEKV